jgi:hypothetical protein
MRRVGVVVAVLLALAGCRVDGGNDGEGPAEQVSHEILYDIFYSGGPGFNIQVQYVDEAGRMTQAMSRGSTWSKTVTLVYPDVTTVFLSGNAVPDVAQPPVTAPLPQVQCILWVDGKIAAQQRSLLPTCQVELTATKPPAPSPSRSG